MKTCLIYWGEKMYSVALFLGALCTVTVCLAETANGPTVEIKQGKLQGKILKSTNGREFNAFMKIPFGKAQRFQAPEAADPWSGILNATEDGPVCKQYDHWFLHKVLGVEDCLTLNIYTPYLADNKKLKEPLPVLVFIHGGDFLMGGATSDMFGPERILNNDVVLVVIQYRVGPLGFLSTGDETSPGNYGLLDQVQSLKWVNENIAAFGGDPSKITISGQGAGGASVILHMLSPLSKGLFQRAIAQSGSALCPWVIQKNPLKVAKNIAKNANCPTEDIKALVECLKKADLDDIIKAANDSGVYISLNASTIPVVENPKYGKFLTESPWKLLKEGRFYKVPLVSGVTEDEGSFILYPNLTQFSDEIKGPAKMFVKNTLPKLINLLTGLSENDLKLVEDVYNEYYKDVDFGNETQVRAKTIELSSDAMYKACNDFTVRYVSEHGAPVHMYVFDYIGEEHSNTNNTGKPDVDHLTDLLYLFKIDVCYMQVGITPFSEEDNFSKNFIDMWTNFTANGNPTPNGPVQWTQTPPGDIEYLRIKLKPQMEHGYQTEKMAFWKTKLEDIF